MNFYIVKEKKSGKYLTTDQARGCFTCGTVSLKELMTGPRSHEFMGIFTTKSAAQNFLNWYAEFQVDSNCCECAVACDCQPEQDVAYYLEQFEIVKISVG